MMPSKKASITVKISDLAFGGQAVSKIQKEDGELVVFVDSGVPGDTVEIELTKIKKQYAFGRVIRRMHDSEIRIPPRCKHFGICGGCQWQFLKYEDQLRFKEKQVKETLMRIGGINNPPLLPIRESPSQWFYRNKMEYSFSYDDAKIDLGLHRAGKFNEIFDLEECYLESQFSVAVVTWMKAWAREKKVKGLKNLVIREARSTGEFLVNLVSEAKLPQSILSDFATNIQQAFPGITSLYHTIESIKKGEKTSLSETLLAGKPTLTEVVRVEGNFREGEGMLSLIFDITPQAFFQPNSKAAEILLSLLLSLVKPETIDIVFDLYCGTGMIGMFFAKLVKKVYGIELNESAIESAKQNAKKNNIKNIEFFCGDVGKFITKIPEQPNLTIVDPPRAGLSEKVLQYLILFAPQKVVYVSCNPTTLARDLKELLKSYKLSAIQPVDLFPQTYHIETIAILSKLWYS